MPTAFRLRALARRVPLLPLLPLFSALLVSGCHRGNQAQPQGRTAASQGKIAPAAVPEEAFAGAVHELLRSGKPTPTRMNLLAGVVSRQLLHANERFAAGQQERGLSSLSGAFFLLRAGELRPEMLVGGAPALTAALAVVAPRGDEGRAAAFLTMKNALVEPTSSAGRDTAEHLAALNGWMRDTHRGPTLEGLGAEQRVQAVRSVVEPTAESLRAATDATIRWIDQALKLNEDRKGVTGRPRREDALEAFRAFRSGAESLVSIYLRHGDAVGALAQVDGSSARKIVPPSLYDRLERAANGGDAVAWRELLAWLWNPERKDSPGPPGSESDPELAVDPSVQKAAIFGTAVEAYRLDPMLADVNVALATMLVQLGLPEAAPLVLADAAVPHPEAALLSGSLALIMQTILREDSSDDSATARRVFAASAPLLAVAGRPEFRGKVEPSGARLRLAMGSIETRAGNLVAAKPLLESSTAEEPTVEALLTLAAIERQAGKSEAALTALSRAVATDQAKQNPLSAAEANLNIFEVQKDLHNDERARAALVAALNAALSARQRTGNPVLKAHAERVLARVLFRFSDSAGAARATERAFVASGQDRHELASTVLEATQRAFLRRDVAAARDAVTRGLAGELADDDLVYAALWLMFTERDAKARPDGSATRALSAIKDDARWPSRLSLWGLGKMKDAELLAAARTLPQKTEASFYTALARKVGGDASAGATLAQVARSQAIDLVEVQLARDLLGGAGRFANGPTPPGVAIP